ncbi:MAG: YqeG family HAD IIIA-type phosphatase [Clostridia bacterium]|nr:YqeG family HAD IIIA-type phosphatase [Clostridia bacterium]
MPFLTPTFYKNRITDITLQDLESRGIRGLLLDVDNTLTTHGSQVLSDDVREWLDRMKAAGIRMTVVSNSWEWRVKPFAEKIGLRHTSLSCKPSPIGFWRGVRRLGLKKSECAAIGDQVFTDIIGANLYGITCVQVMPIEMETGKPFLALKRRIEKRIYEKRKGQDA